MDSSQPAVLYYKGNRIASGMARFESAESRWVFWPVLRLQFGTLPGSPATLKIMETGDEVKVTNCEPSLETHDLWYFSA